VDRCFLHAREGAHPEQRETLGLSDILVAELEAADEYVVGVPMHSFTIASVLRLWIDQVACPGARAGSTEKHRKIGNSSDGVDRGSYTRFPRV
jgi:FMN-dependent NADH-azoreductase